MAQKPQKVSARAERLSLGQNRRKSTSHLAEGSPKGSSSVFSFGDDGPSSSPHPSRRPSLPRRPGRRRRAPREAPQGPQRRAAAIAARRARYSRFAPSAAGKTAVHRLCRVHSVRWARKKGVFRGPGGGNTQKVPMRPRRCRPERAFGRFCGFSARFFALPKGISAVGRFRSHFASMSLGGGRLIWVLKISTFLFFSDPTPRRTRPAPEAPRYAPLGQPNRTDRVRYALCDLGFPMWRVWCGGKAA